MLKNIAVTIAVWAMMVMAAWGAEVTLEWDPNTETDLAGYRIYYGNAARPIDPVPVPPAFYPNKVDVGNVTVYTITGLVDENWCFAATAYNTSGAESAYSNEICTGINSIPPAAPGIRIKVVKTTTLTTTEMIAK